MANICANDRAFSSVQYRRLAPERCERVQCTSLEILERPGVRLQLRKAADLLAGAGALVSDGMHMRVPSGIVEKALNTVPKRVTVYGRRETAAIQLEGHRAGLDGQHIDHAHTWANIHQHWCSHVFDRGHFKQWQAKGGKDPALRAADHVEKISREHQSAPLSDDVQQRINAIVRRAEAEVDAK